MARGPWLSSPHVHYLCCSPCVQQAVLQRRHHTQHKMEACRTRHCFNLPCKRLPPALLSFRPSSSNISYIKPLSFLPSLSLCKREGNILLKHLLDYGAEPLLCCLFLFQWSQQHCWKEATCFLEGNQAQNNTKIIKSVSQELHT